MLNAGSTTRLCFGMVTSMFSVGVFLYIFLTNTWLAIVPLLFAVHGLILTIRLIDLKEPVVSVGHEGLTFSSQISGNGLLPWGTVRNMQLLSHVEGFVRVPWLDYLIVTTNDLGYFDGASRLLPSTWLGCYILPTRLIDGGAKAAENLVAAAKVRRIDNDSGIENSARPGQGSGAAVPPVTLSSTYHTPGEGSRNEMDDLVDEARRQRAGPHMDKSIVSPSRPHSAGRACC